MGRHPLEIKARFVRRFKDLTDPSPHLTIKPEYTDDNVPLDGNWKKTDCLNALSNIVSESEEY